MAKPLWLVNAAQRNRLPEMRELVDQALRDARIVRLAMDIVRDVPQFDDTAEARTIYEWVKGNIRFTKDCVNKDKFHPPAEVLKARAGDCNDISRRGQERLAWAKSKGLL